MTGFTPSQVDAAAALLRLALATGYPPSEREIGAVLGITQSATSFRLRQTARLGLITTGSAADRRARGARACQCGSAAAFLPVAHKRGGAPGSHNAAAASRDGVCPMCSGVVLLPARAS